MNCGYLVIIQGLLRVTVHAIAEIAIQYDMLFQQKVLHCLLVGPHRMGGCAGAIQGVEAPQKAIAYAAPAAPVTILHQARVECDPQDCTAAPLRMQRERG